MAARAPGLDTTRQEPECYNCGTKGHFAVACPEETRKVPAGLAAFRQRQASGHSNSPGGSASHSRHSNGMVVTRYPPPPGTGPQITHYTQPPQPPQPPLPLPGYSPPPGPPEPYQWQQPWPQPPQSGYGGAYPQPGRPQVPDIRSLPAPPPPGMAHPLPSGPPYPAPPQYHQGYSQPGYYPPGPPGPPAPQPYATPSFVGVPSHPPGSFPPGPIAPGPPPPPGYPPQPQYSQPPGYGYNPQFASPPSYPPANNFNQQGNRGHGRGNQHQQHRGRHNQSRGKGPRQHGSQRGSRGPSEQPSYTPTESVPTTPTSSSASHIEVTSNSRVDDAEDDEWAMKALFTEIATKAADPVGKPLPAEWNDDPTLPPAFGTKVVRSSYFSAENREEFSQSIRDSSYWEEIRFDPSFKKRRGMISHVHRSDNRGYWTYPPYLKASVASKQSVSEDEGCDTDKKTPDRVAPAVAEEDPPDPEDLWSPRIIALKLPNNNSLDTIEVADGSRPTSSTNAGVTGGSSAHQDFTLHKRGRDEYDRNDSHQAKRSKIAQHGGKGGSLEGAYSSPGRAGHQNWSPPSLRGDVYSRSPAGHPPNLPNRRGTHIPESTPNRKGHGLTRSVSHGEVGEKRNSEDRRNESLSTPRNDSGYHSGQSQDRRKHEQPPKTQGSPQARYRSQSSHDQRSRSRSPARNTARSPSAASRSRSSSPMNEIEYMMLGMVPPEEEGRKKKSEPKKRPPRVDAAFSRRW